MKHYLTTAAVAMLFSACGTAPETNLNALVLQRDSIKSVRADLAAKLAEIEAQIARLDTSAAKRLAVVTTLPLQRTRFEHFFTVQGVVETDKNAQIFPEVPARVMSVAVREGERVSKGQTLLTLDGKVIGNQIDEVKSRLSLAETVYRKQEKLWEQKIGSEIQFLEAKNNYESLKQNLETLQAQRAMYTISAPFDGMVDEVLPKEGEMANPAMPAIRLINMNEVYIKADVTERYLGQIHAGDSVSVSFPSIGVTRWTTIDRIGNYINPGNRTFKIRLGMKNAEQVLKPNLLGELNIRDYVRDSAVVVPTSLVQLTPSGDAFIYILEGDVARKVSIKTGLSHADHIEVISGLNGSEILIEKGARSIKDGERVQVN